MKLLLSESAKTRDFSSSLCRPATPSLPATKWVKEKEEQEQEREREREQEREREREREQEQEEQDMFGVHPVIMVSRRVSTIVSKLEVLGFSLASS